jgi:hypothetical protein
MKRFVHSLSTLRFWKSFFENAQAVAVFFYLSYLSESGQYLGFWVVVIVFGFYPVVQLIEALNKRQEGQDVDG